jgi:hypothetical protein
VRLPSRPPFSSRGLTIALGVPASGRVWGAEQRAGLWRLGPVRPNGKFRPSALHLPPPAGRGPRSARPGDRPGRRPVRSSKHGNGAVPPYGPPIPVRQAVGPYGNAQAGHSLLVRPAPITPQCYALAPAVFPLGPSAVHPVDASGVAGSNANPHDRPVLSGTSAGVALPIPFRHPGRGGSRARNVEGATALCQTGGRAVRPYSSPPTPNDRGPARRLPGPASDESERGARRG